MLRISLIVALVASIAALVVSQMKVADKIHGLETKLAETEQHLQTSQAAELKAKKDAKDATAAADQAKKALETTKTELAAASMRSKIHRKKWLKKLRMRLKADNGNVAFHRFTLFPIGKDIGDAAIGLDTQNSDFGD